MIDGTVIVATMTVLLLTAVLALVWAIFPTAYAVGYNKFQSAVSLLSGAIEALGIGLVVNGITEIKLGGARYDAVALLAYGIILAVLGRWSNKERKWKR